MSLSMLSSPPTVGARKDFVTADDIRTRLLDSIIQRLENRTKLVENMGTEVLQMRAFIGWLIVAALLALFCALRYGVSSVDVHQVDEKDEDRVVYRDRQLEKTSEAFRARHQRDK